MRKKKVLGMMLSFTLAFGMALPVSMAMPTEGVLIATDSNAIKKEAIATDSNAIKKEAIATDSNAIKKEAIATDSNATKAVNEHIETCIEGCTGEDCECVCHMPSLFERLMATKNMEEFELVVESVSEEELIALSNEEVTEVEAHIIAIEPKPLPAITIDNIIEDTVQSEIVYLTLSYTDVAPFGAPVVGKKE